jgi:hypothetical protein
LIQKKNEKITHDSKSQRNGCVGCLEESMKIPWVKIGLQQVAFTIRRSPALPNLLTGSRPATQGLSDDGVRYFCVASALARCDRENRPYLLTESRPATRSAFY